MRCSPRLSELNQQAGTLSSGLWRYKGGDVEQGRRVGGEVVLEEEKGGSGMGGGGC